TGKKADTAIVALRYAIKLLLKNHPATNVTGQQQGLAVAGGRCLRNAVGCDALVGKATEMTPGAKFDLPGRVFIALFVIPSVLDLSEQQGRIVDAEVHAVAVTLL